MNRSEILDVDISKNLDSFSDSQLIGFLVEKDYSPKHINEQIRQEIQKRGITNKQIEYVKQQFNSQEDKTFNVKLGKIQLLLLLAVLIIHSQKFGVIVLVIQCSIFTTAVIGIKKRFQQGIRFEKMAWRILAGVYLVLTLIVLISK